MKDENRFGGVTIRPANEGGEPLGAAILLVMRAFPAELLADGPRPLPEDLASRAREAAAILREQTGKTYSVRASTVAPADGRPGWAIDVVLSYAH